MALEELHDLHGFRQFDQELLVPVEMMDVGRIASGEARHRGNVLPVGDRHEFGLMLAILAEGLDAERLLDQRLDADVVIVLFVLVGPFPGHATAPDAGDRRALFRFRAHAFGPHSSTTVSVTGSRTRVSFSTSPSFLSGSSAATPLPTPGKTGRPRGTLARARDRKKAS